MAFQGRKCLESFCSFLTGGWERKDRKGFFKWGGQVGFCTDRAPARLEFREAQEVLHEHHRGKPRKLRLYQA